MFKCVIVRYTKLPTMAQYKVGSSQRVPPKKKYRTLTLKRLSTILVLVRRTWSRMSTMYLDYQRIKLFGEQATLIPKKCHGDLKTFISKWKAN